MGARGVSVVATILLVVALSPVRPEPEPAQSPFKAGATKNTKNPYCSIACRSGAAHTLCQYSAGPPSTCKDGRAWPLNGAERGAVLHAHNLLRNKMASGGVPPFPSGANMRQMEWDAELEQIAQRWADQCSFAHDQCRDSGRFTVGQNVAIYFSSAAKFPPIESRVHSWYDEIRDYAYAEGPFSFSFATGHFTQVVWGDTWLVGCGRARYEENGLPTQLLVCNYGPAGNVETEPLYRQGAPCSACQPGTACSPTYPALCAGQGASQLVQFSLEPAAAPLSLTPSTVAPTAPPAIGLRGFFGDVTQNSILPSSVSPALFGGSTLKPFTPIKPFAAAKTTTSRPFFTTARPATPRPTTAVRPSTAGRALSTTSRPISTTARPATRPPTRPPTRPATKPTTTRRPAAPTTPRPATALSTASPAARALPSTTATPVLSTESPDEFGQPGCPIPKSVGPTCKQHRAAPLSAAERATMLDFHNVKRSAIAAGDLPGFKPAADMKQMYWDEELEALAQTWADKCEWGHDPCRSTARWAVKGQNLGLTFSLDWTFPASTERVEDWYQELKLYNYTTGPFTFAPATSHFTQLAWADTYLVGCGRTRYMSEHGLPSEYLVCNYGPGGNIFGNPLYREGPPCAKCPFSCSDRYPGLCTRIEDSNEVGTGTPLSLQALKLDEPSSPPFLEGEALGSRLGEAAAAASPACPRPAAPGPACINHQAAPLSQAEKGAILHRHNVYRSQIASGVVPGLPAAASMLQMTWSDEVAGLAQRWADQCSFGYDECAKTGTTPSGSDRAWPSGTARTRSCSPRPRAEWRAGSTSGSRPTSPRSSRPSRSRPPRPPSRSWRGPTRGCWGAAGRGTRPWACSPRCWSATTAPAATCPAAASTPPAPPARPARPPARPPTRGCASPPPAEGRGPRCCASTRDQSCLCLTVMCLCGRDLTRGVAGAVRVSKARSRPVPACPRRPLDRTGRAPGHGGNAK